MTNKLTTRRQMLAVSAGVVTTASAKAPLPAIDLEDPWTNLSAYLRARSDVSGRSSVSWTSGLVYSLIPGRPAQALLLGQGVKCTRCVKTDTGYEFLERECVIFCDPVSGQPLDIWRNPFTDRMVEVFHIRNASAGSHLAARGQAGPFRMNYLEHSGDVTFYDDLFYSKPSALNIKDYGAYVGSDLYEGAGIYHFHVKRADLNRHELTTVPASTSHTGIRQWLPWMEMGAWPGGVVLPSRGKKLTAGVVELPKVLREWLERHSPEFLEAPSVADQKNNQRRFYDQFRDHVDAKRRRAADKG